MQQLGACYSQLRACTPTSSQCVVVVGAVPSRGNKLQSLYRLRKSLVIGNILEHPAFVRVEFRSHSYFFPISFVEAFLQFSSQFPAYRDQTQDGIVGNVGNDQFKQLYGKSFELR